MASAEVDIMPSLPTNHYQNQNRYNMTSQTNNLQSFLLKHILKKGNPEKKIITNTRIGEKTSNGIMGGSYSIDDSDYKEFLNLYNRDIINIELHVENYLRCIE